jgi:hypothetical protein
MPYLLEGGLVLSVAATLAAFLLIGSLKSRWSCNRVGTLIIGSVAAGFAYAVGHLLSSVLA